MDAIPNSLKQLIEQFSKLPGIGKKTAERLSIYILKTSKEEVLGFSEALSFLKNNIQICNICHSFIDESCSICDDLNRDNKII